MRSETSVVATQYRLRNGPHRSRTARTVRRHEGIDWCEIHGISKSNYYYRLRQVRRACLETLSRGAASRSDRPGRSGTARKDPIRHNSMEPGLDICLRDYKIRVTEATCICGHRHSDGQLPRGIRKKLPFSVILDQWITGRSRLGWQSAIIKKK